MKKEKFDRLHQCMADFSQYEVITHALERILEDIDSMSMQSRFSSLVTAAREVEELYDKQQSDLERISTLYEKEKEKWEKLKEWIENRAPGISKKDEETGETYILIYLDKIERKMQELEAE